MLIDRSGADPKVLLGRRHAGHKFMPGKFVFPGGRIEMADAQMSAAERTASGDGEKDRDAATRCGGAGRRAPFRLPPSAKRSRKPG